MKQQEAWQAVRYHLGDYAPNKFEYKVTHDKAHMIIQVDVRPLNKVRGE